MAVGGPADDAPAVWFQTPLPQFLAQIPQVLRKETESVDDRAVSSARFRGRMLTTSEGVARGSAA